MAILLAIATSGCPRHATGSSKMPDAGGAVSDARTDAPFDGGTDAALDSGMDAAVRVDGGTYTLLLRWDGGATDFEVVPLWSGNCPWPARWDGGTPHQTFGAEVIADAARFSDPVVQVCAGPGWEGVPPVWPPVVDFDKYRVVAAYGGMFNNSGRHLEITGIEDLGGTLQIEVTLFTPCFGDQAYAIPVMFARIPRIDAPTTFVEIEKLPTACGAH